MLAFLKVLNAFLIAYLLLLSLRIIMSWFRGSLYGGAWDLLVRLTEPYLALFRGLRLLRQGMFDFTPIAAILALVVLMDIVNALILYGRITLGLVLGSTVGAIWSTVAFILLLFLIVGIVRLVVLLARRGEGSYFDQALDTILRPVVGLADRFLSALRIDYRSGFTQLLVVTILLILVVRLLGDLLFGRLVSLLYSLPL